MHRHTPRSTTEPQPDDGAPSCASRRWQNPAARGGVQLTERCGCGATRTRYTNGSHAETGPWSGGSATVARGRPRGQDAARREAPPVICYVTPDERAELIEAAAWAGADVGPWVREAALRAPRRAC